MQQSEPQTRLQEEVERHRTLLAMITHDLKSPMVAILTATQDLLQPSQIIDMNPESVDHLKLIHAASSEVLELIGNILAMARLEAGKERIEPIRIDNLSSILKSITDTFRYEAHVKDIHIVTEIDENLPDVYWDESKIHYHVINNIISNALKHTPAGGEVRVRAGVEGACIAIRILDNGPGVSMLERKRIFSRFENLEIKSLHDSKLAGLGLYNAHLFIRKHNGRITISDGLGGKGTCFTIMLPPHPYYQENMPE